MVSTENTGNHIQAKIVLYVKETESELSAKINPFLRPRSYKSNLIKAIS